MARARNIKPALFKNELLGVSDPYVTLLFLSLWMLADREGRLEDRPLRIKAETFPYREGLDINGYLTELQRMGFIVRYMVADMALIQIVNFKKHQTPHNTEKASDLPGIDSGIVATCGLQVGSVTSPLDLREKTEPLPPDLLIPDSLNLIPDSPKKVKSNVPPSGETAVVFAYWQQAMNHQQAKLDAKRDKAIKGRLKDGYTVEQLCKAVDGCKLSPHHMGHNDTRTIYDDIELICRDGPRVDKFMALVERGPGNGMSAGLQQQVNILDEWLQEQVR
jgi:hypothetical protein